MTDLCDHEKDKDCVHCTEGCEMCGELGDINDNSLCEGCQESRNEYAADCIYESMKYGD